jgi:hypothetical protein
LNIDSNDATIGGFILTWLAGVFGIGKTYGALKTDVDKNKKDIAALQKEFITNDGEPRLMSYAAHDKIQAACQGLMLERHNSVGTRLDHQEKILIEMKQIISDNDKSSKKLIADNDRASNERHAELMQALLQMNKQ